MKFTQFVVERSFWFDRIAITNFFIVVAGKCYQAVREETNRIRDKLMAYNPYKGELPDKEAVLLYKGESVPEDGVWDGKRIIEMATERPTWFSRHLRQRWRLAAGIDTKPKNNNEAD